MQLTVKDKAWIIFGGLLLIALAFLSKSNGDLLAAFLRRKSVDGLATAIKKEVAELKVKVAFTESRLNEEAIKYRQLNLPEDPASIRSYYHEFFADNGSYKKPTLPYNA